MKTAALEVLVPSELKQYLVMSRARQITYEQNRSESQAYIEVRRGHFVCKTVASKNTSDPMDVDGFGKGDKKDKKEKDDDKNAKKGGKGKNRSQNPNPNKEIIC